MMQRCIWNVKWSLSHKRRQSNRLPALCLQSYGVCSLGLDKLWLLIVVYGLSASVFSSLSLALLRLPRWVCLVSGAVVHGVLVVVLMAFSPKPNNPAYEAPLLVISVLWGLGTALNKTGVSSEYCPRPRRVRSLSRDACHHEFLSVCSSPARNAVRWGKGASGLCLHHLPLVAGHRHLRGLPLVGSSYEGMWLSVCCVWFCFCFLFRPCSDPVCFCPSALGQTFHTAGHFVAGLLLLLGDGASPGQQSAIQAASHPTATTQGNRSHDLCGMSGNQSSQQQEVEIMSRTGLEPACYRAKGCSGVADLGRLWFHLCPPEDLLLFLTLRTL